MSIIREIELYLEQFREKEKYETPCLNVLGEDEEDEETNYKKSWSKMTQNERINRLMLFHASMVESYDLEHDAARDLQKTFTQNSESVLADERVVKYDTNSARIVSINGLKRDYNTNKFYIESKSNKPEGIKLKIFVKPLKN